MDIPEQHGISVCWSPWFLEKTIWICFAMPAAPMHVQEMAFWIVVHCCDLYVEGLNIFCVDPKNKIHTGLEWHEGK